MNDDENLLLLIYDISQERCFARWKKRFGFELDTSRVFYAVKERTYSGVLAAFFEQLAKFHGMDRWGDKTPEYTFNLPVLENLFPDAQFIHIVRDGRDVALSNLKTHFGNKNLYLQALDWKANLLLIDEFFKNLPGDRYTEIKYEEFIRDPVPVFSHLIEFLGIEDNNHELIGFIGNNINGDLYHDNGLKWKKMLSSRQINTFEKLTSDLLSKYGYEVSTPKLWKPNFMTKLIWCLDNKIKKNLVRDYRSDNRNKIQLRMKELVLPLRKLTAPFDLGKPVKSKKRGAMQEY